MSSLDHSQDWHKMKQWRRQPADIRVKDSDIAIQQLLDWAAETASNIGKVPLAIKERTLLADLQRVKGGHVLATAIYESLIDYAELVSTTDFNPILWDKEIISCLSKAFTGYVESGSLLLPREYLLERLLIVVVKGQDWLKKTGGADWHAALQLQKGLLLKFQGKFDLARNEMREAYAHKERHSDAYGYTLATHRLENADLLCLDTIAEYSKAIELAKMVEKNDELYDWAREVLVNAYLKSGNNEASRIIVKDRINSTLEEHKKIGDARTAQSSPIESTSASVEESFRDDEYEDTGAVSTIQPGNIQDYVEEIKDTLHEHSKNIDAQFKELLSGINNILSGQNEAPNNEQLKSIESRLIIIDQAIHGDQHRSITSNQLDEIPKHVICLAILPITDESPDIFKERVLPALRQFLQLYPYYWEVDYLCIEEYNSFTDSMVVKRMKRARAYVIDISDDTPDILTALGYFYAAKEEGRPLIVLERQGHKSNAHKREGVIQISYPDSSDSHAIEDISEALKQNFDGRLEIVSLNATRRNHYLSSDVLEKEFDANSEIAKALALEYETLEELAKAGQKKIQSQLRNQLKKEINLKTISAILEGIERWLKESSES